MKSTLPIALLGASLLFTGCDARVNTNPPAENNTTIVTPGEKKTETNTTVVAPAPAEKKTETTTTVTPGGSATQQKTETTR
jgi:hypothetical protein